MLLFEFVEAANAAAGNPGKVDLPFLSNTARHRRYLRAIRGGDGLGA